MAVEHRLIGTEEEGLAVIQTMKAGRKKAKGQPPGPDAGDLLVEGGTVYRVAGIATGPTANKSRHKTRK
jgi:hypothetical protein